MKKNLELLTDNEYDLNDELRPEYNLKELRAIARRKNLSVTVQLEPDVARYFPDNTAVNEALRTLIRLKGVLSS